MAPEIYRNNNYDPFKADIFSLGIILFNLITGDQLLRGNYGPTNPIYKPLINGSPSAFWKMVEKRCPIVKSISIQLRLLLSSMLHPDPAKRISIGKIKSNAWLKGSTISPEEFMLWVDRVGNALDYKSDVKSPPRLLVDYKIAGIWKLFSQLILTIWN
jgi:serine/threonine protein kinase